MPLARRIHEFFILSVGSEAAQQWIGLEVGIGKESIFNTAFEDAKCTQFVPENCARLRDLVAGFSVANLALVSLPGCRNQKIATAT